MWLADLGSSIHGGSNYSIQKYWNIFLSLLHLYALYALYRLLQVISLLQKLELQESAKRKGHFALFNCLVLGHTKYKDVQRICCIPFPNKMFYGSHRMDPVIIQPPGVDNGAFDVSPATVWYARVLLLFSASAVTNTGSKSFNCALISTLETFDDPENGNYSDYTYHCNYAHYAMIMAIMHIMHIIAIISIISDCFLVGCLESVGSRVVYELDYKKPILYVIPIQNTFLGALGDRRPGAGDGCWVWFVNSWALGWSRDL
jgi:hypothetical protein